MKMKLWLRAAAGMLAMAAVILSAFPAAAAYDIPIELSAADESVYMYNMDTGEVLLDQNSTQPRYIASTTKMMTALLFLESGADLNTTITIPERLTQEYADIQVYNGADMKLKIGENIRLIDLLYGLLLPSANDAASTIADYLTDGDIPAFVQRMNARAEELGCTATNFTCAHGLYDAGNVSTAQDLAKIAEACYANDTFMMVADTLEYTVPADNLSPEDRVIKTSNPVINPESSYYRDSVSGIKTGFTTLAGRCFVTTAKHEGHTYMLVLLGSKKEGKNEVMHVYEETDQILDWAFSRYADVELVQTDKPVVDVPLRGCDEADAVPLYAAEAVTQNLYADAVITRDFTVKDDVRAPVKQGDVLGTYTVTVDGAEVAKVDLIADKDYESALLKGGLELLMLLPVLLGILFVLALLSRAAGKMRAQRR